MSDAGPSTGSTVWKSAGKDVVFVAGPSHRAYLVLGEPFVVTEDGGGEDGEIDKAW
jgi:hypothetical protein